MAVLLSTFNGEQFLDQQLTSLNEQKDVEVAVYVNDDGSTDGTLEVLKTWEKCGLIVSISQSCGSGSTKAFLKLLRGCKESYAAFCDQDDVWERDKLSVQIQSCETQIPTLVFSRRQYLDSSGKPFGISPGLRINPSIKNALVENIAGGNTILLNQAAIKIVNSYDLPDIKHYDSWIYLLISAFGKCVYVDKPLVNYRIHQNNQVGLRKLNHSKFETSVLNFVRQAQYMADNSKITLPEYQNSILTDFVSILKTKKKKQKIRIILSAKFRRQRMIDQLGFRLILFNLLRKGKI